MTTPSEVIAGWIVDKTYDGFTIIVTLSSGQRYSLKSASLGGKRDNDAGVLYGEMLDDREILIDIQAITSAEERG